jgi:drug/metabolite transporter (DMT)-like permease
MKEPDMSNGQPAPRRGGAFDIRNVIAALFGFYGIVLIVMGIVADSPADRARTGDVNANLWTGIAMAAVAVVFVVWTRLRPVVIESRPETTDDRPLAEGRHE